MVLPNSLGTRLDLTMPLGSPNEPAAVVLYKATVRTLSATTTGVSDEEIKRQSKRHNGTDQASSMSILLIGDEVDS